jgi:cystathionine beta-lyase
MDYNFDEIIDRTHTNCIKYDGRQKFFGNANVMPLWVADMDFKTPDFIVDAVRQRAEHPVYGYTFRPESYSNAIVSWLKRRHDWSVKPEWISFSPGVVAGLTLAIKAFSAEGDGVVVQTPVYNPFFDAVKGTNRRMVENPLKLVDGRYTFDLEDLRGKIDARTRLLLLCNPQNPGGMVWTPDELLGLADICLQNKILIISDEIHSDLIYPGNKHTPMASLSEAIAANTVTCMAPSKTFNMAGLTTSFLVIPNKRHLVRYERELHVPHLHMGNLFGTVALEAAYNNGADWVDQLMIYLRDSFNELQKFVAQKMPKVKVMKPEGTYLIWLDFSAYGLNDDELNQRLIEYGVGLNRGIQFGKQGSGYMRLNMGCPRSVLMEALERIEKALGGL